nr:structural maintenance of chromosomes protein 4-like [Lytechinus pictus]
MPVLAEPEQGRAEGEAESQPMDTDESIPQEPSTPTAQPRLLITQIVTENFKSYAGKVVLGPFHKSFSCIIGPNGSGKSNVIDSMLFVFGYRASKIRSKKLSVLIHKSEDHKDLKSCTVAVHFQKIIDTGQTSGRLVCIAASFLLPFLKIAAILTFFQSIGTLPEAMED